MKQVNINNKTLRPINVHPRGSLLLNINDLGKLVKKCETILYSECSLVRNETNHNILNVPTRWHLWDLNRILSNYISAARRIHEMTEFLIRFSKKYQVIQDFILILINLLLHNIRERF